MRDDLGGALVAGIAVVIVFRYLFGDAWPLAIGGGVLVACGSLLLGVWLRRGRRGEG